MIDLTEDQIERYSRHILLQDVGLEGQEKILNARVLIVGAGGLGAPAAMYLAAAGVGHIGIVDADVVDLSNLQRQIIHFTKDVGQPKVESAKEKMLAINPDVEVTTYHEFMDSSNAKKIIEPWDFVIDGTDNFPVKFLINDACVMLGKAFSHGGILRFRGQTFTHVPGSACYRCFFKEPPPAGAVPTCSQAGVLGAIAGMLGTIQAAEALKYILGVGELLVERDTRHLVAVSIVLAVADVVYLSLRINERLVSVDVVYKLAVLLVLQLLQFLRAAYQLVYHTLKDSVEVVHNEGFLARGLIVTGGVEVEEGIQQCPQVLEVIPKILATDVSHSPFSKARVQVALNLRDAHQVVWNIAQLYRELEFVPQVFEDRVVDDNQFLVNVDDLVLDLQVQVIRLAIDKERVFGHRFVPVDCSLA